MLRCCGALIQVWRRERDSNPRYRCQYDSLANCSFRPLRHLSERAVKVKRQRLFQKEILFLQKIIKETNPGFFNDLTCAEWCNLLPIAAGIYPIFFFNFLKNPTGEFPNKKSMNKTILCIRKHNCSITF